MRRRWLVFPAVLVSAALAAVSGSTLAGSREPATPAAWQAGVSETIARCDFDRIAIKPGGREALLWLDRRPQFVGYNAVHPASALAVVRASGPATFISLAGEVSALNWMADGASAEFLIDGRLHAHLDPRSGVVTAVAVGPAWRAIGVKNLRWGGLSEALRDQALTGAMPQGIREIGRRRGFVLSASVREYHGLGPQEGEIPATILDTFYPEALYSAPPPGSRTLAARPVFDARTGHAVGWQDPLSVATSASAAHARLAPAGALLRDEVALGAKRARLHALPDGSHWLTVEGEGEAWSRQVCGPGRDHYRTDVVSIAAKGVAYPALLQSSGEREHLIVRVHGGPYSSVLDDFPSEASRRVVEAGGTILEVSSPGSRHQAGVPGPRVDPATMAAYSEALSAWIAKAGFDSITVLGESFGAVGAIDFALRQRSDVRRVILIAPLTQFDPELSLAGNALARGSFQWRGEQVILGDEQSRRQFAEWLDRSLTEVCAAFPLSVILGAEDVTAPATRQAPCALRNSVVIPEANHYTVLRTDVSWDWLSGDVAADDAAVRGRFRGAR